MKELTTEQKAKRYDEAIEKFDVILNLNTVKESGTIFVDDVRKIFPELAESEDEKIREWLICYFKEVCDNVSEKEKKGILAWLEKQGEQKPSEDEDREYACQSSEHYTRRELMIYNLGIADGKRMIEDAIKETEQKPAWSEEDEINLEKAIWYVENPAPKVFKDSMLVEWLKNLRGRVQPQPKQEWSEEEQQIIKDAASVILDCINTAETKEEEERLEELADKLQDLRPQSTLKSGDLPHWKKITLPNDNTTGFNSDYFCHNGYCINYKELFEKLPKEN